MLGVVGAQGRHLTQWGSENMMPKLSLEDKQKQPSEEEKQGHVRGITPAKARNSTVCPGYYKSLTV